MTKTFHLKLWLNFTKMLPWIWPNVSQMLTKIYLTNFEGIWLSSWFVKVWHQKYRAIAISTRKVAKKLSELFHIHLTCSPERLCGAALRARRFARYSRRRAAAGVPRARCRRSAWWGGREPVRYRWWSASAVDKGSSSRGPSGRSPGLPWVRRACSSACVSTPMARCKI